MSNKKRLVVLTFAAIFFITAALKLVSYYTIYYKSNTIKDSTYLYVRTNADYNDLIDSLKSLETIKNFKSFEKAADKLNLKEGFKPGRYEISNGSSNKKLIYQILNGWQKPWNLTIAGNIRTLDKLSYVISKRIESDSATIINYLKSDSIHKKYGFGEDTFISMFLQDSYEIYWTTSIDTLTSKLYNEYKKFWDGNRDSLREKIRFSRTEVYTLASIVYQESKNSAEQPLIASVYLNRLKIGMPLQADPTIIFAHKDFTIKRVLFKHLRIKSPYNTYTNRGLPPGPISMAPKSVIDAVLNCKKSNYLYFCASPSLDGTHLFASSLSEHSANARKYQRAISRR